MLLKKLLESMTYIIKYQKKYKKTFEMFRNVLYLFANKNNWF